MDGETSAMMRQAENRKTEQRRHALSGVTGYANRDGLSQLHCAAIPARWRLAKGAQLMALGRQKLASKLQAMASRPLMSSRRRGSGDKILTRARNPVHASVPGAN
jgi:hypothetical protein